jgi:hypothetical protein
MLRQLQVAWLVLPSIRSVLPMWRYSFSFMPLTLEEQAALEPHIVSPGGLDRGAGWCCVDAILVLLAAANTTHQPAHLTHAPPPLPIRCRL